MSFYTAFNLLSTLLKCSNTCHANFLLKIAFYNYTRYSEIRTILKTQIPLLIPHIQITRPTVFLPALTAEVADHAVLSYPLFPDQVAFPAPVFLTAV